MIQYIVALGFFMLVFVLMALALNFSKYKKRPSGCCGGGHCATDLNSAEVNKSC